ncbi:MAG: hypothetical protein HRT77_03090 [Halioglobus sp.]|nr:hypothetical protein [Halioglobus sp.]
MLSSLSLFNGRNARLLCIVGAALVGTLLSFELAYEVGNGAFRADYFRHFFYSVIPFLDGSGNPALLFKNHHASPMLHLHQMLIGLHAGVSLRADAYIGITLFFFMAVALAAMALQELSARSDSRLYGFLVALLVSILMTGLTASRPITWPLIYLQAYFLCLGLLVAVATYRLCAQPGNVGRMWCYLGAVTLAVMLHTSYGMLFSVASLPALARRVASTRDYRLLLVLLVAIVLVTAWNNLALPALGQMELRGAGYGADSILTRLKQWPLIVAAFGKALLTGVHGDTVALVARKDGVSIGQLVVLFGLAVTYGITTCWALLQSRRVLIAGIIMLAVVLGAASALLSRGGTNFAFNIDASRYVLLYRFGAAAFAWALADSLVSFSRWCLPRLADGVRSRLLSCLVLMLVFAVVFVQWTAFGNLQRLKAGLAVAAEWSELALFMKGSDKSNTFVLKGWQAGDNPSRLNDRVISWLVRRQVNVFSPGYRAMPLLENYMRGRAAFNGRQPARLRVDTRNCITHPAGHSELAWRAQLNAPSDGRFQLPHDLAGDGPMTYFVRPGVQALYGMLPAGMPLQVCFPPDVSVESFTYLPDAA